MIIALLAMTLNAKAVFAKTQVQALRSFSEMQKLNPIEQINYIKAMSASLKKPELSFYKQTVAFKYKGRTQCFYDLFAVADKCQVNQVQVIRFFKNPTKASDWESLRFNVHTECAKAKRCKTLKNTIDTLYSKANS